MEKELHNQRDNVDSPAKIWKIPGLAEAGSGRNEKAESSEKKSKKKPAWLPLMDNLTRPEKLAKTDKMAEVIDLDERRQAKANRQAEAAAVESVEDEDIQEKAMDFPLAVGAEPPISPPPMANWAPKPTSEFHIMNMRAEGPTSAGGNDHSESHMPEAAGSVSSVGGAADFENRAAEAPLAVDSEQLEPASEQPHDMSDNSEATVAESTHTTESDSDNSDKMDVPLPVADPEAAPHSVPRPDFIDDRQPADPLNRRNGFERSARDVHRAAWTGAIFGWLVGRRGKRKAVERAVANTRQRFEVTKEQAPVAAAAPAVEAPKTPAEWLKPEVKSTAAGRMSSEHLASTPLADALAMPAAVAAARLVAERRIAESEASLDDTQLIQLAKTIKVDGIPLHQIYESKQIDKGGLRTVVAAYLRGESVEKHLTQQIIEKQKSFERDPHDRRRTAAVSHGLRTAASRVTEVLVAGSAGLAQGSQRVASKVGHSVVGTVSSLSPSGGSSQKSPSVINADTGSGISWLSIVAIVIIYGLIILLWVTRPR